MEQLKEKYLTVFEVAAMLRCTETHVNRLCRNKKLKAIKPLGKWLIDKQALFTQLGLGVEESVNEGLEI